MALSSPRLAATQKVHNTQKMKPYRKATEPPEGSISPIEPARAIHVLRTRDRVSDVRGLYLAMSYFKMANAMASVDNVDRRCCRNPWPDSLEDVTPDML